MLGDGETAADDSVIAARSAGGAARSELFQRHSSPKIRKRQANDRPAELAAELLVEELKSADDETRLELTRPTEDNKFEAEADGPAAERLVPSALDESAGMTTDEPPRLDWLSLAKLDSPLELRVGALELRGGALELTSGWLELTSGALELTSGGVELETLADQIADREELIEPRPDERLLDIWPSALLAISQSAAASSVHKRKVLIMSRLALRQFCLASFSCSYFLWSGVWTSRKTASPQGVFGWRSILRRARRRRRAPQP